MDYLHQSVVPVERPFEETASMPSELNGIRNTLFAITARNHSEVGHSSNTKESLTVRLIITTRLARCVRDVESQFLVDASMPSIKNGTQSTLSVHFA